MNPLLFGLKGKTAAITGASRGIGLAIAMRFAREGANVVFLGRDEGKLLEAVKNVREQISPSSSSPPSPTLPQTQFQPKKKIGIPTNTDYQWLGYQTHDVLEFSSWKEVGDGFPEIDILVNSAGVTQRRLLVSTDDQEIDSVLRTNLHGAIYGCKIVGRKMMSLRKPGCIINISSLLATKGAVGSSVYAASKAGLLGLTMSLALEYSPFNIRVNAIVPGYIATDMTQDLNLTEITQKIPLRRLGTPDEVADAAGFLAKNDYANNCILNLDGGLSAT